MNHFLSSGPKNSTLIASVSAKPKYDFTAGFKTIKSDCLETKESYKLEPKKHKDVDSSQMSVATILVESQWMSIPSGPLVDISMQIFTNNNIKEFNDRIRDILNIRLVCKYWNWVVTKSSEFNWFWRQVALKLFPVLSKIDNFKAKNYFDYIVARKSVTRNVFEYTIRENCDFMKYNFEDWKRFSPKTVHLEINKMADGFALFPRCPMCEKPVRLIEDCLRMVPEERTDYCIASTNPTSSRKFYAGAASSKGVLLSHNARDASDETFGCMMSGWRHGLGKIPFRPYYPYYRRCF